MLVDINQTGYGALFGKVSYREKILRRKEPQKEVIYGKELRIEKRYARIYTEKNYTWRSPYTERNCTQELYTGRNYKQKGATHKAEFHIKRSYAWKRMTREKVLRMEKSKHGEELHTTFYGAKG